MSCASKNVRESHRHVEECCKDGQRFEASLGGFWMLSEATRGLSCEVHARKGRPETPEFSK